MLSNKQGELFFRIKEEPKTVNHSKRWTTMTPEEKLRELLATESMSGTLAWLRTLSNEDGKALVTSLKKLIDYYHEYLKKGMLGWGRRATPLQAQILELVGIRCLNLRDYRSKLDHFSRKNFDAIMEFYQPTWLSKYINDKAESDWIPSDMTYQWLMKLKTEKKIAVSPLILSQQLCNTIFRQGKGYQWTYHPKNLEVYPETLNEHFWWLFQYETGVANISYTIQPKRQGEAKLIGWASLIVELCQEQKIPRQRLLRTSLQACLQDFNRNLIGWYIDLFLLLEPTTEELIALQDDLLQTLNASQSKVINAVLKIFKQLVKQSDFKGEAFLDYLPVLLASETKSIVRSCLMIMDQLGRRQTALKGAISVAACTALIQEDASLQLRAAKLIVKYSDAVAEDLKSEIALYQDQLRLEVKEVLADYIVEEDQWEAEDASEMTPKLVLADETKIPSLQSVDDLIFLASQALDGNEPWHFDLLPAALLQFQDQIDETVIEKLAPAFQRVRKLIFKNGTHAQQGQLDHLLGCFLFAYEAWLITQFPKMKPEADLPYASGRTILQKWEADKKSAIYHPFRSLLIYAMNKLINRDPLPMLSTPTHRPHWIDPKTYIKRLAQYQHAGVAPNPVDWQIAMSRVAFENETEVIALAQELLTEEYLELTLFLLGAHEQPREATTNKEAWRMAIFTRYPGRYNDWPKAIFPYPAAQRQLQGGVKFQVFNKEYLENRYNYHTRKNEKVKVWHRELKVTREVESHDSSFTDKLRNFFAFPSLPQFFLYESIQFNFQWIWNETKDVSRFLSLTPHNAQPVLAEVLRTCCKYQKFWEAGNRQMTLATAQALLDNWQGGGETAHLFMAYAITCDDKTIRAIAAEIWRQAVSEQRIDSELLGKILGQMMTVEFFPLKRFLDLIPDYMLRISNHHHQELERLLTQLILGFPAKPPRNSKKLLEIYRELRAINRSTVLEDRLITKLEVWKEVGSLKKVVGLLLEA